MTKTLTEQWREGTLEKRYYYVKYFGNGQKPFVEIELKNFLLDLVKVKDSDKIEVVAPVPSYEELQKLKKDLDEYALTYKIGNDVNRLIEEENKRLKEQLQEANKMLLGAKHLTVKDSDDNIMFELISPEINDYIKKWGVK